MQRLMILRHAKAEQWYPGAEDFPRALRAVGREHAARVATWICEHQHLPDAVLCSPAQRARETLSPLLAMRPELDARTSFVPQIYGASTCTLVALLDRAFADNDQVLIVGHNPGFEMLAFEVIAPSERRKLDRLPTGTLLMIEFDSGWPEDAGHGRLAHFIRGKKLQRGNPDGR
jgi:phosphohistidine phosphatase